MRLRRLPSSTTSLQVSSLSHLRFPRHHLQVLDMVVKLKVSSDIVLEKILRLDIILGNHFEIVFSRKGVPELLREFDRGFAYGNLFTVEATGPDLSKSLHERLFINQSFTEKSLLRVVLVDPVEHCAKCQ